MRLLDQPLAPSVALMLIAAVLVWCLGRGGNRVDGMSADDIDARHGLEQEARQRFDGDSEYYQTCQCRDHVATREARRSHPANPGRH